MMVMFILITTQVVAVFKLISIGQKLSNKWAWGCRTCITGNCNDARLSC